MNSRPPLGHTSPHGQHPENSDQHSDHDGHDTPQPLHISPYTALEVRSYADSIYPGIVKRAHHNSYRVKKITDIGIRRDGLATIKLANLRACSMINTS